MDSSADASSTEAIIAQLVLRYVLLEAVTKHSYKDWHSLRWVSRYLRMEAKELGSGYVSRLFPPTAQHPSIDANKITKSDSKPLALAQTPAST